MKIMNFKPEECQTSVIPESKDTLAVSFFPKWERAHTVLCVEVCGEKLQLNIRAYSMGMSVLFPAMTKIELIDKWLSHNTVWGNIEVGLIYDSAILRLIPDYFTKQELKTIRTAVMKGKVEKYLL